MSVPKFKNVSPSIFAELKLRVSEYFHKEGKSPNGNFRLYLKATLLLSAFILLYIHLVFFTPPVILAIIECIVLGGVVAAIGFNVMHDGAHGSFSKYKWMNIAAAHSLNVLGGSSFMWNMKHNIIHHAYTNIDGVDDDIDIQPWMRMTGTQKKYKLHRYQHWYFWFFYCLLYLSWVFMMDYQKYFKGKIGKIPIKKMNPGDHITFWGFKVLHLVLFVVIPIMVLGFLDWFIGFIIFSGITGFVLSFVFQLAHTVEHTSFASPQKDGAKMKDEWAIHQLKTTANFATHNKLVTWLVGGLNFQIEHHLFPKISHIHYPAISKIIRKVCSEYGVTYIEYSRVRYAAASHISLLRQLGR